MKRVCYLNWFRVFFAREKSNVRITRNRTHFLRAVSNDFVDRCCRSGNKAGRAPKSGDNHKMHLDIVATWRRLTLVLILAMTLFVGACRPRSQPDTRTDSSAPAKTESNSNVAAAPPTERPLFAGRIENVSMYPVPNHREDLAISLVVSVNNAGISGIAQGWNLEVNSPSRRVPTILEPVHVNGLVDMPGSAGSKVDLGKEDLVLKTTQVPIDKGARVKGILTFVLPRSTEAELANNNTRLIVHFKDTQGHSYPTAPIVVGAKATSVK